MIQYLSTPPAVFVVIFATGWIIFSLFSKLAFRTGKKADEGTGKPYACGEDDYNHTAQPDYSIFFPFAFFFTLAHVATLIVTTVPQETKGTFAVAAIYIVGAALGLTILLRRP
jgi:hypothetical protein